MKNALALKKILKSPVYGVSVQAFGRTGLENFFPNFSIVCLSFAREIVFMRKVGLKIFCLEEFLEEAPGGKRNPTTLLLNKKTQNFIKKRSANLGKPWLLLYKSSPKIEKLAQKNNWLIAANPANLRKKLENKKNFKKILQQLKIKAVPGEIMSLKKIIYEKQIKKYPTGFVIQIPERGGGAGTCFIKNKKEFKCNWERLSKKLKVSSNARVVVSKFIEGYSPSITACVTPRGILRLPPQLQLIDLPELYPQAKGNGVFCGHDWSASKKIPKDIQLKMGNIVEKIGHFLKKSAFKGIFGVDFIVDIKSKEVFPVELNPRLLGVFPVSTFVQTEKNEIPLMVPHLLAFLGKSLTSSARKYNLQVLKEKEGAHFFMTAPFKPFRITGLVNPGVHKIKNGKLVYLRPGYQLKDLSSPREFLLIDGVPSKGSRVVKDTGPLRMFRVVTSCKISQNMGKELNSFGKKIIKAVYASLKIVRS